MRLRHRVQQVGALALMWSSCALCALAAEKAADKKIAQGPGTVRAPDTPDASRDFATEQSSPAAQLVRAALQAEADGDAARRAAYLQEALAADPDYAPAHWHSGHVRSGDAWLPAAEAATSNVQAGKVTKYRALRDQSYDTAAAHLSLARWCASAGLKDEERVHLVYGIYARPTKKQRNEAIRQLGLVRRNGIWLSAEQFEQQKERLAQNDRKLRLWKPRFSTLRRDLEGKDQARHAAALAEIKTLRDPAAVPSLARLVKTGDLSVRQSALDALSGVGDQNAIDAILRLAVFADDEIVRDAAAECLSAKSIYSYAPTLMNALEAPVDVSFSTIFVGGISRHQLILQQDGPLEINRIESRGGTSHNISIINHPRSGRPTDISFNFTPDATSERDAALADYELAANTRREEVNQRVANVLRKTTGNDFTADPRDIWKWWLDFNEMYQPTQKPVNSVQYDTTPATPVTYTVISVSCFPAGTPVETSTGPLAIEQIKPGDCVLAQNPDSGELAFKPVMAVTVRPTSPVIEVTIDGETIRATRGHPFWVDGIGWQMAKELKAGQWLHTLAGPKQIDSATQQGEAECHNLVVADFNSYFVGQKQILVHDNNLREVTTAIVPGLVAP